ncbi:MAG: FadR family transcriptional regulator [Caulobacterales bacterium]|nr:FadR family transcriptional regulator [Caulobacterales bacterium]
MATVKKAQGLLFDMVHDIAVAGLGPGDRLPSQAELMRRYRAGPTPLREALRLLEFCGLVSLKPGPNAGAVLEPATAEHLAGLVAPFLSLAGVTYGQLMDAWAATEPLLAAAAASNPDRALVTREIAAFAAEPPSDDPVPASHAIDFHDAVARAAGNPALGLVLQVLSYVVADLYWASTDALPPGGPVRHDHHEIAEAILAGQAEEARRAMEAHARGTSDGILARVGHRRDEPFLWPRRPAGLATYRQRPMPLNGYAGSAMGSAK